MAGSRQREATNQNKILLQTLWVAEVPVSTKPNHVTSSQNSTCRTWSPACNSAKDHTNKYAKDNKNLNIFLHPSFPSVTSTCQTLTVACKNGHKNSHQSGEHMSLTSPQACFHPTVSILMHLTQQPATLLKKMLWESPLVPMHLDQVVFFFFLVFQTSYFLAKS
ncbi:ribonuclease 8-like [Alexandromys fortis]|uniref:ribonuclease 8-like n=1 Tax=Alexandromys fortis TaxID=100897 RepID=UPI0021534A81|nr:ribonuclease 8-like [Microtus fortis]